MKTKLEKRSPLRDKPLRHAGQSLDEQIDDKALRVLYWVILAGTTITMTFNEWARYYYPQPNKPILLTLIAIIIVIVAVIITLRAMQDIKKLKLGRDGEKIVAEELIELIRQGATVFHDIQGNKFNLDHVVVSPHGIFLVETKTYSKPVKKDAKISFDENHVFIDGREYERNPIDQVRASTKWLQDLLKESTGIQFPIRPVILFPGWWTEPMKRGQNVWILNPKSLPKFISNEPIAIKETDVHLVTFHLSRYIRTFEPKK